MNQLNYLTNLFAKFRPKCTARGVTVAQELSVLDVKKCRGAKNFQVIEVTGTPCPPLQDFCLI